MKENIVLVNLRIVNVTNLSDEPARVRTGEIWGGGGILEGRVVIRYRLCTLSGLIHSEKRYLWTSLTNLKIVLLVDQTDSLHIRIPTQET